MDTLQRDLEWWRTASCPGRNASHKPDIEATLCRVRAQNRHTVLTNMMLLQSRGGSLSALILVDPSDPRGPKRHWPGRTISVLQQLAELQQRISEGVLRPLPDFVAIVNPHDQPEQLASSGWCGLLPILSNSRTSGVHRDLLMPDFSFASTMYLTNALVANMSQLASVPQGWPVERSSVYEAGLRAQFASRRQTLFWRGGSTHPQRKSYADGLNAGRLSLPAGLAHDAFLCDMHCPSDQGLAPAAWCGNRMLLSLPGHSWAVGFKYTMLCGSLVVRGAQSACNASRCEEDFEQWWQPGLRDNEHYVASREVDDLPQVLGRPGLTSEAEAIGRRGADYTFHVLEPAFVLEYWHALLTGYAGLHKWRDPPAMPPTACERPPLRLRLPTDELNQLEQTCLRGVEGQCRFGADARLPASWDSFLPILPPEIVAAESRSKEGLERLYRRHAHVVPCRFGGVKDMDEEVCKAVEASRLVARGSTNCTLKSTAGGSPTSGG